MGDTRHVDQIPGGHGQLGREACSLGADGILGNLHHHQLPFPHQLPDIRCRGGLVGLSRHHVVGVQKAGLLQADVDERRLHAGQYPHHLALVDIADDAASLGAFHQHFLDDTVLHQRYTGLHGSEIDEDLGAHGPLRCPLQ